MSGAPVGQEVSIGPYDTLADIAVGDGLVTETGRAYLITAAHRVTRGAHKGHRWRLRCVVQAEPPEGVPVHVIRWYRRGVDECTKGDHGVSS